ncbi:MAG: hypothetical protein LBB72_05610 [Spirochaetaceae bacterium]|jgi:hypothetical protein|nr:hypothetical protein [Spirochaetaceae bacterium]
MHGISRPFLYGRFLAFCLMMCVSFSCGIENYIYLDAVETVIDTDVNKAQFILPNTNTSTEEYFRYYAIYYRIYLSDLDLTGTINTATLRNSINPVLNSHFNSIEPYIDNENYAPSGIYSVFTRLNYFSLYVTLEDKINEVEPGARLKPGELVSLDFTDSSKGPFMTVNNDPSTSLYLFRSSNANPYPQKDDRLFFWTDDLFESDNINAERNRDVEKPVTNFNELNKTAYVSMYVLAVGIDTTFSPVYSRPCHIGIFKIDRWF